MPLVLPPGRYAEWLDPRTREARLADLLQLDPADGIHVAEVGPAVNSPKNAGPGCLDAT